MNRTNTPTATIAISGVCYHTLRMVTPRRKESRLARSDWINAALEVMVAKGIDGVSVEALAAHLGVTKGSFYWHFETRSELIAVALDEWAIHQTQERIDQLSSVTDPRERLLRLVRAGGVTIDPMDIQLVASLRSPVVSSTLQAHHRLWLDFAENIYRELGCPDTEAALRAVLAYSAYIGLVVLHTADPSNTEPVTAAAAPDEIAEALLPAVHRSRART